MNQLNNYHTITLKKDKVVAHHISDGNELISSEIQASTPEQKKRDAFLKAGANLTYCDRVD